MERLVGSALVARNSSRNSNISGNSNGNGNGNGNSSSGGSLRGQAPPVLIRRQPGAWEFSMVYSLPPDQLDRALRIMTTEGFHLRDVVKYGLIGLGYSMEATLFDEARAVPSQPWVDLVRRSYQGLDMEQVVASGIRVLSQLENPPAWPPSGMLGDPNPDLYRGPQAAGAVTLTTMSLLSALLVNMQHMNMAPRFMLARGSSSRFSQALDQAEDGHDMYSAIPPDLRPTPAQRTFPHHAYIDLIPWPQFRSNVLHSANGSPPLDQGDLCMDLANGGVRCWGNAIVSLHGRGEGVPWDSRSWEALPWFLDKYQHLTGGPDGEIARNSAWWRSMAAP